MHAVRSILLLWFVELELLLTTLYTVTVCSLVEAPPVGHNIYLGGCEMIKCGTKKEKNRNSATQACINFTHYFSKIFTLL